MKRSSLELLLRSIESHENPPESDPGAAPAGIIIRVNLCWNFGRLVSETSRGYRDELKTPSRDVLGAHFGHKTCQQYGGLRPFKTDLLFILGVLSDPLQTPLKGIVKAFKSH